MEAMRWLGRALTAAAQATAVTWAVWGRLAPERPLEIDENNALWAAAYTPDYRPGPPLKGALRADVAIIGGGFTGVSTAYHMSRRFPNRRIVLLEARGLGNGATGRNGGMMLHWLPPEESLGPELDRRIYQVTDQGMDTIQAIIRRHNLDVSCRRDGCLTVFTDPQRAEEAHAEVEYRRALGIPDRFVDRETLERELGFQAGYGAILDPRAGQLNGAQYVRALRPVLQDQGVEIYEQTPVYRVDEGRIIRLVTPQGEVRADAVVLATNGYTGKLGYFRDAVFPVIAHVMALGPLTPEAWEAVGWRRWAGYNDDLDRIAYSTRTREGYMVFGGGSRYAVEYIFGNGTAYRGNARRSAQALAGMGRTLHRYLPGTRNLPVAFHWTGTLGLTLRRNVLIGVRGEYRNLYYAVGFSGHGVTLTNVAGEVLTDLYAGDGCRWRGLPFLFDSYSPLPPEPFRWLGYQLFTRVVGHLPRERR